MKSKPLWRVSIATTPEAEDAVAEMLGAVLNCAAVSFHNLETGVSTATVYCEARPAAGVRKIIAAGLAQIKQCGLKIGSGKITIAKVRREDWAESWKRHFQPIEIGNALLVKPSWSKRRPRKNQAVVILNPGLSFGTGQHPTTAFCLGEIVAIAKGARAARPRVQNPTSRGGAVRAPIIFGYRHRLGILAIAAAKLGCRPVHAFDFDRQCGPDCPCERPHEPRRRQNSFLARRRCEAPAAPGAKIRFDLRQPDFRPAHRPATTDCGAVEVAAERWRWRAF